MYRHQQSRSFCNGLSLLSVILILLLGNILPAFAQESSLPPFAQRPYEYTPFSHSVDVAQTLITTENFTLIAQNFQKLIESEYFFLNGTLEENDDMLLILSNPEADYSFLPGRAEKVIATIFIYPAGNPKALVLPPYVRRAQYTYTTPEMEAAGMGSKGDNWVNIAVRSGYMDIDVIFSNADDTDENFQAYLQMMLDLVSREPDSEPADSTT